jgi:hypothetical protein
MPGNATLSLARQRVQEDHADDWLQDVLDGFGEDDYIIFDCPGQVCQQLLRVRVQELLRPHSQTRLVCADRAVLALACAALTR